MSTTQQSPLSVPTTSPPLTGSIINEAGASDSESFWDRNNPLRQLRNQRRESETIQYLESLFERARTARWRFERQWYVNLNYYFGKQWINWINGGAPDLARLYEPQAPPWRVRLTVNRIKPAIRREMSKVMKEKPTAYVIPATTEDSDIAAARAGEAVFEHLWRTLHMKDELWIAQFWRCVCGTGFIKDWWDPTPQSDGTGTIGVECVTPFHLYFGNLEQYNIDKNEYIIHLSMKSPEAVRAMYGIQVRPDSVERGGGVIESQFLRALDLEPGKVTQVAVKEIWIKPNARFPAGAMFIWAAGKLLYQSTDPVTGDPRWPLYKLEYPFTKFDGVPTGRFYGDSSIIDLLPLQKEYNRTRSQIIEAKNQMSKPQLLAPKGSVDANKITSEPGLVIFYVPGFEKPTPLELSPLPSYVPQELDRTLLDMADISGQHEVSSGTVPTGVSAASALSFLQEQDDTMLAPIINSLESGIERLGRHFLCHVHQWWDQPKMVKVLGADNTWEIKEFASQDLRNNTDLNIQAGSAMPRSIAAKQAFIMELAKMQIIGPEEALRHLELAETTRMYEEAQLDRRHAERENGRMSDPSIILPAMMEGMFGNLMTQLEGAQQPLALPQGEGISGPPIPPGPPQASPEGGLLPPSPDMTMPNSGVAGAEGAPPLMQPPTLEGPVPPAPASGGMGEGLGAPAVSPEMAGLPMPPPSPVVMVNTWDNHEVHIQVHNDFRKRQEFESLPPALKEEFERHVALHRAALGLPPEINPQQMQQIMAIQQTMPQPVDMGANPMNEPGVPQGNGSQGNEQPQPNGTAPL